MDIPIDIGIEYVEEVALSIVSTKEEGEGSVSPFPSRGSVYHILEKETGIRQDHTEIDSRLLVSVCCQNSVIPYLSTVNDGKLRQEASSDG
jgi:hypothetical protein